jgi:hypothetical protein
MYRFSNITAGDTNACSSGWLRTGEKLDLNAQLVFKLSDSKAES